MPKKIYYYEVKMLVRADMKELHWDASCDETFGMPYLVKKDEAIMMDYKMVDEKYYKEHRYDTFDQYGGI